jgi:hypothetical protein
MNDTLFDVPAEWENEWVGMPEFVQEKKKPFSQVIVRFETEQDMNSFASIVGQKITPKTKSLWHPFKSHWGNGEKAVWSAKK